MGVELDQPSTSAKHNRISLSLPHGNAEGKNDGSTDGTRLFLCAKGHGLFVRPSAICEPQDETRGTIRMLFDQLATRANQLQPRREVASMQK